MNSLILICLLSVVGDGEHCDEAHAVEVYQSRHASTTACVMASMHRAVQIAKERESGEEVVVRFRCGNEERT